MQSESINELAEALSKAQAEMKDAALSKINPHFKNRYADLPAVRAAVTGPLAKNGLTAIQTMALVDGKSVLETTLAHKSGQWIKSVTPILVDKPGMQALGSGITYARRYALAAICGVASDEDDDGEASEGRGKNGNGVITTAQKDRLVAEMKALGVDTKNFLKFLKVDSLDQLPAANFDGALAALEMKRKAAE
jgi:hypothetical protein